MKNYLLPVITLVVGLAVGYYAIPKTSAPTNEILKDKLGPLTFFSGSSQYKDKSVSKSFLTPARTINSDTANHRIKEFQKINSNLDAVGIGIKTSDGNLLQGVFIDRATLEKILATTKCTGVSIYVGKHPDHPGITDRALTLYFVGAYPNDGSKPNIKTMYLNDGNVYEYVDPCPISCGDLGL